MQARIERVQELTAGVSGVVKNNDIDSLFARYNSNMTGLLRSLHSMFVNHYEDSIGITAASVRYLNQKLTRSEARLAPIEHAYGEWKQTPSDVTYAALRQVLRIVPGAEKIRTESARASLVANLLTMMTEQDPSLAVDARALKIETRDLMLQDAGHSRVLPRLLKKHSAKIEAFLAR